MKIPDITILQMFQNVRNIVSLKTQNQQMPWESTSLTGDFYFYPVKSAAPTVKQEVAEVPAPKTTPSVSLNEEYDFPTVKIGDQVWMAENLKTDKYNDGTNIPLVTDSTAWSNLTTPGYCWYKNDTSNKKLFGALYNWYTVNTGKLCPKGWHVPTDADWTILTTFLGGESTGGSKLKESGIINWASPNSEATDETGFRALPGGYRFFSGTFLNKSSYGFWWSSSENFTSSAWLRGMYYNSSEVSSLSFSKSNGFSVRCVRD
jgi:uncharacterized protein (TIGR02145 family)